MRDSLEVERERPELTTDDGIHLARADPPLLTWVILAMMDTTTTSTNLIPEIEDAPLLNNSFSSEYSNDEDGKGGVSGCHCKRNQDLKSSVVVLCNLKLFAFELHE